MARNKSAKAKTDPFYSDDNIKELEKRYVEYKQYKGIEQHDLLKTQK